jgi:hypothetical protein
MGVANTISMTARAILPPRAIKWLRGDFKSVQGRLNAQRELIKLHCHKLRGGSYIEWYTKRMDGFAAEAAIDPATKRLYHDSGIVDLETLKLLGMKPTDKLHEFGCGFLRSAYFFIDFLDTGNFSANDTSGERIRTGIDYIRLTYGFDVPKKKPELIVNTDNSFDWLRRKPDIIWCHAVFTHMPPADIEDVIRNLKKVMTKGSVFYFTYSQKEGQRRELERMGAKDWWHRHGFFAGLAERHGLVIDDMTDFIRSRGGYRPEHRLASLRLA